LKNHIKPQNVEGCDAPIINSCLRRLGAPIGLGTSSPETPR